MKTSSRLPFAFLTLLVLMAACNLPSPPSLSLQEQAATIVAATLRAQTLLATPTAPRFAESIMPTLILTQTPAPTLTPTYSTPLLKVNASTNCRSGPGQTFDILITFNPGTTVEIVGRYPQENYWIVKNPNGGICWIWGEYSTATGSYWAVPSMTPPPAPAQSLPAPPGNLYYTFSCTLDGEVTTSLTWADRANNEQGYRIYRNGTQVAELPANTTAYVDTFISAGGLISYGVSSFNAAGNSAQRIISFSCQ